MAISPDGRYVVFRSWASNLVPGDTNVRYDVFVRDIQAGTITRLSTDSNGNQANDDSFGVLITADGRYVAFASNASNLVAGDTNAAEDVFLKDLQTGTTTRVSRESAGNQANSWSDGPSISADGSYVAFDSMASNLVPGDTNNATDIFVKDVVTGTIARVSTDGSANQGNGESYRAAISADGRYLTFTSYASNLVPGDTNGYQDVFRVMNPFSPNVASLTPSAATVTDNNVGTPGFTVRITYDKPMNTNRNPVVTFTPDVSTTLASDTAQSWWVSNTTFKAAFDVADANVNVPNIGINVSGALDADGNLQTPYSGTNNFGIDTLDPAPARPAVLSAAPSIATVTDNNVGTAAFSVRIVYNEPMNTNLNPVVTFSPDVASTLTYNRAQSWWVSNSTFVARYDVADANVAVANVGINVASARDAIGNIQTPYIGTNAFSIDTLSTPAPRRPSRAQRQTWRS